MRAAGALALGLLLWSATPAAAVEVQRVVSPGGIEAWLVEDHSVPLIAVEFGFLGGSASDPAAKAGLAELVSGLLDEGAGDLDSQAFQQALEDDAIRLSFDARRDTFDGSLRTLSERRAHAFELLRLSLTKPRFDAEPVQRIRNQILARLARDAQDPQDVAGRTFWRTVFPHHPYGQPSDGDPATVSAITVDDLRGFVARRLARDTLKIGVAGDITPAELAPLLDSTFGALPAKAAPLTIPDTTPSDGKRVVVVQMDVPQSVAVFGQAGIKRHDPDFYAAYVMNYILGGGGFSSRLTEEVREKRGLAYSVYSYLAPLDHSALVVGGLGTANARVAESLQVLKAQWRRMAEAGPTAEELEKAKTYLTGSYPLRFTDTESVAEQLLGIQRENLGIDYIDRRNSLIEAVTLDDVRRVAKQLLTPDRLTVVVVGKPDGVTATN